MLRRPLLFALALLLAVSVPHLRAQGPDDPFSDANQAKPAAKPAEKTPAGLSKAAQELAKRITFEAKFEPGQAKPGEVVKLTITGTPAKDCYTYPVTKRTPDQNIASTITYVGADGLKPLWPLQETEPEYHLTLNNDLKQALEFTHSKPFTWTQEILIEPATKPGKHELTIKINLQVCNKSSCLPGDYAPFSATLEVAGVAATPSQATLDRLKGPPAVAVVTPPADELQKRLGAAPSAGKTSTGTAPVDFNDLWALLTYAALSALLMLLTPCVFPMIPITVNFFLKQSEKEHHRPFTMASVYSGTIIVMLTVVMLALGNVVIALANNGWFNLALGLVLIVFALSLFGMYEIELPSFLARFTSSREGKGGMAGTVFMAMTFTITSFTCTGPFLGLMLSSLAISQTPPPLLNLILAAVVYSATFAAPFFLLAMFPSLLKKLPKSGGWLNVVKVVMGFLELGAALKFLSNADFAMNPGNTRLFNYDTVLSAWIALSIACSLYLLGFYRLPHDDKEETIAVPRMVLATIFLGLAVYLAPAMLGIRPAGIVGENVVAFLPLRTGHDNDGLRAGGGGGGASHKDWHMEYKDAYDDAIKNNKLIFIDFTGVNCTNCRDNESNVFPLPDVAGELKKMVKVSLYVDIVPNPKLSSAQASEQAASNKKWQDVLADASLPTYLVFRPAADAPFDSNGVPKGTILSATNGKIFDVPAFVAALRKAQETAARAGVGPGSWHFDYKDAYAEAIKNNKLIFVDFFHVNSAIGRNNEVNVLSQPGVNNELQKMAKTRLHFDMVPDPKLSREEAAKLASVHADWVVRLVGAPNVSYVVLQPSPDGPFDAEGYPKGKILASTQGWIFDVPAFVAALREAQKSPAIAKAAP
jgi:thiol:disulfide interchange protein